MFVLCVCMRVCVRACVHACVFVCCVCACVCGGVGGGGGGGGDDTCTVGIIVCCRCMQVLFVTWVALWRVAKSEHVRANYN